jgi:hypothetical protein
MKITIYPLRKWMNEVRNGDKKGNGRTKKGTRLGSDVGEKLYKVHSLYNWRPPYFVYLLLPVILRISRISESRYHGWGHSTNEKHRRTARGYINPLSSAIRGDCDPLPGTLTIWPCCSVIVSTHDQDKQIFTCVRFPRNIINITWPDLNQICLLRPSVLR